MITDKNFIFTGMQSWDITIGSNAKDIALEISKQNRVLYINTPLDKKTYIGTENTPETVQRRKVIKKQLPELRQINPNLWVLDYPFSIWPVNFLPDGYLFDLINKINNKKMYQYINKILKRLSFNDYIHFIDNDVYRSFYAKEILKPSLSIYYRRDNLTGPYWDKHKPRLEPLLCRKCDLIVANSIQLAKAVETFNSQSFDVGQGVDLENYDAQRKYTMPSDMSHIAKPIIGYLGYITSLRLDADLLYAIARQKPHYSFIMVGEEDNFFKTHKLHQLSNIYFLGMKKTSETINYIANFDVCINPQLINNMTIGNYPRKIDEYLALGKPVVATRTETMEAFDKYVWNCIGPNEYIDAINQAINSSTPDIINGRIQFAHTHTWENSVNKIYSVIQNFLTQSRRTD